MLLSLCFNACTLMLALPRQQFSFIILCPRASSIKLVGVPVGQVKLLKDIYDSGCRKLTPAT